MKTLDTHKQNDARKRIIMAGPVQANVQLDQAKNHIANAFSETTLITVLFKIRLDKNGIIVRTKPEIKDSYFKRETCIVLNQEDVGKEEVMFFNP